MDKGTYVLSGSLPVHDDTEAEQIERIRQHLGGIAKVYLAHDQRMTPASSGSGSRNSPKKTAPPVPFS